MNGIRRRTIFTVTDPLRKRFWKRVMLRDVADCWPWLGAERNGYGAIKHEKKVLSAHVVAWVLDNGRMPKADHIICHTCDNRLCCNPSHLYEGTYRDNVSDADRRRTIDRPRGEEIANSVITEEDARNIFALKEVNGWGKVRISRKLGISEHIVSSVLSRKSWNHVPIPDIMSAKGIVGSIMNVNL